MDNAVHQPLRVTRLKRVGVHATVAFPALFIGFVPMGLVARTRANERDAVQQALRLTQLENTLVSAAVQARRGDYEPAREAASTFYINLPAEAERSPSGFSGSQRAMLQPLLAQRDHDHPARAPIPSLLSVWGMPTYRTDRRRPGPGGGSR